MEHYLEFNKHIRMLELNSEKVISTKKIIEELESLLILANLLGYTIKYSKKAFEEMEEYINNDNLEFENPPTYYKRKCKGGNVGDFNYGKIIFDEIDETIKINKVTYKLYNECFEE
jgi:hypothetical protein